MVSKYMYLSSPHSAEIDMSLDPIETLHNSINSDYCRVCSHIKLNLAGGRIRISN